MSTELSQYDLIVIGGGAAGIFGAITAAESMFGGGRVLVLEKSSKFLGKVKISGGGRCNVTHDCHDPKELATRYPRGSKSLIGSFHRFGPSDTIEWFASRGVELKVESDGRMFPTTDSSQTVIDCLMQAIDDAGVEHKTGAAVTSVERTDDGFCVELKSGESLSTRNVLVATGGTRSSDGGRIAESLGHTLAPPVPSLFTFHIESPLIDGLQGLSVDPVATAAVGTKLSATGPLLITHWGMSGPAILKLSAWGARELSDQDYQFTLEVNWLPGADAAAVFSGLRQSAGKRSVTGRSPFAAIPKRLWERFTAEAGIAADTTWSRLSKDQASTLVESLHRCRFEVTGKSLNKDEFVTCGGVLLKEVQLKTMESKVTPGLYFAGEVLDVDGITGGFNFQHAWTTGFLAGNAIATRCGY
ncbi:NAD(P)/FAD-dependent oxidoreductase [Sulfuriroseicoccus oceanibius]|uniref:NAD(P)/FAD-dependent oxidoreductase n=1 Tax=Sulfuriroseicoccus oceanibius TaxID=2707525 RepID=A0A6B3LD23_9BACT|nr:NAD(P)/FAD-dependent oxidoreductase [Sulfuriroseicoccus oceanibius]QQL44694.1 NAD(P)/FAD-dependent oxidoreductase [Sulfuriroseicoccus oceanibius]